MYHYSQSTRIGIFMVRLHTAKVANFKISIVGLLLDSDNDVFAFPSSDMLSSCDDYPIQSNPMRYDGCRWSLFARISNDNIYIPTGRSPVLVKSQS